MSLDYEALLNGSGSRNSSHEGFPASLPQLGKTNRSAVISEIVKEGILSGLWKPGDRLSDEEIAEKLGVSRSSVRESLSSLIEAHLVERVHWKGYFIRKLPFDEIESIFEIRIALEELAIRKVLAEPNPALCERLDRAIAAAEEAITIGDRAEYLRRDFTFHTIIYQTSKNKWIQRIIENLRLQIDVLRRISVTEDYAPAARVSSSEHRKILDKMKGHDVAGALQALRDHLNRHYAEVKRAYGIQL